MLETQQHISTWYPYEIARYEELYPDGDVRARTLMVSMDSGATFRKPQPLPGVPPMADVQATVRQWHEREGATEHSRRLSLAAVALFDIAVWTAVGAFVSWLMGAAR